MRFSQRIGKSPVREAMQLESIDSALLNGLWNTVLEFFLEPLDNNTQYHRESQRGNVCRAIWVSFFKYAIDQAPTIWFNDTRRINCEKTIALVREWFYKSTWDKVYDFIEFIAELAVSEKNRVFEVRCNAILRMEHSAYRIVNNRIAQVTTDEEIQAIEQASVNADKQEPVQVHLDAALSFLTNKQQPDYRNSVKESISAVEAYCKLMLKDEKATLGKALNEIERKHGLQKGFKNALSSLYGFTSESGGIRHALLENDIEVNHEDAKFMLVVCSSFINYIKEKQAL
ncbi:AbiJ-NTD4 domain-containing protein [Fibrella sp. WM1]|uniref:AbiJ-NTD4 domain-containing protein n=1 Tax=Fibrella musci TaxID=3242485 RepID=UPI0035211E0E